MVSTLFILTPKRPFHPSPSRVVRRLGGLGRVSTSSPRLEFVFVRLFVYFTSLRIGPTCLIK